MKKAFQTILWTLMIFSSILPLQSAWCVVTDDVMEAFAKKGLKLAGKNTDEIADITRKTAGSFRKIIGADGDYARRASKLLDDDTIGLGKRISKIDDAIKSGRHADDIADAAKGGRHVDDLADIAKQGRHTDDIADLFRKGRYADDTAGVIELTPRQLKEFERFSKGEKALALSVQSVVERIAKMPDGADIIMKVGKKGVLLGAAYGDETLIAAYKLNKSGALSLISEAQRVGDADLLKLLKESQLDNLIDAKAFRRVRNLDEADLMKQIVKKYGPKGVENISEFCVNAAKKTLNYAANNPGKVLTAAIVITVMTKPEIIVDAAGNIVEKSVEVLAVGLAKVGGRAAGEIMRLPSVAGNELIEHWLGDAPEFLKSLLKPLVGFLVLMGVLHFFSFTRFIPRAIFGMIGSFLRSIFPFKCAHCIFRSEKSICTEK